LLAPQVEDKEEKIWI